MKKIILLIIICLTFTFSGCFLKPKDLGQMLFPVSLGISYENEEYNVYLQVLDTSTLSIVETESSSRDITFVLIHSKDKDLSKALGDLGLKSLTYISAIKVKSIVIHKSIFFDSPVDYHDLITYFINTPLFRSRVQLFATDVNLKDFYSVQYMLVGSSVYSHTNEEEPRIIRGYTNPSFLLDSLKSDSENNRMYHFPVMNITEENIDSGGVDGKTDKVISYKYDGICFTTYDEDNKYDCLSKQEALGYRWYIESKLINIDVGNIEAPINIIVEDLKWSHKINNDKFIINVSLKGQISINNSNNSLIQIKDDTCLIIKNAILDTLNIAYEKNIDIYHLNDYASRKKYDLKYNLDNVIVNVDVEFINNNYY